MNWVKQMISRRRLYRELSEEIREHLEEKIEELVGSGMSRKEAAAVARREFGNVTLIEGDSRGVWRWPSIEGLLTDIRFGARLLRRSLTFTAVAVLTLALGIGANTAVFSIVDAVLLRPLPYKGADRLVAVWSTEIGQAGTKIFAPYRDFEEFKAQNQSFEELAALTWARAGEILAWRGSPHEVMAIPASADFFSLLGVPAAQGRAFGPEDLQSGCTVVLAHSFWQTELAATADVVGSTLTLNGKPCAVAGVMPNGFEFYPKQTSVRCGGTSSTHCLPQRRQFINRPFRRKTKGIGSSRRTRFRPLSFNASATRREHAARECGSCRRSFTCADGCAGFQ